MMLTRSCDARCEQELTKKITARIEQTMAARASQDGGGLKMVSSEFGADGKIKPLKATVLSKKSGRR